MAVSVYRADAPKVTFPDATGWVVDDGFLLIEREGKTVAVFSSISWEYAQIDEPKSLGEQHIEAQVKKLEEEAARARTTSYQRRF